MRNAQCNNGSELTAQSPVGIGMSWARAAPAKVAARMAKDFILKVGGCGGEGGCFDRSWCEVLRN
jgi:hypothetical protein